MSIRLYDDQTKPWLNWDASSIPRQFSRVDAAKGARRENSLRARAASPTGTHDGAAGNVSDVQRMSDLTALASGLRAAKFPPTSACPMANLRHPCADRARAESVVQYRELAEMPGLLGDVRTGTNAHLRTGGRRCHQHVCAKRLVPVFLEMPSVRRRRAVAVVISAAALALPGPIPS